MTEIEKKKILIVEDEMALRGILADKLRSLNYEVLVSNDGRDGLKQALENHPDLIVLDLIMPGMGGHGLMKELRQDEWGKDALVLVVTNMAISDDAEGVKKLGALDILVKSNWRIDEIAKKVGGYLA